MQMQRAKWGEAQMLQERWAQARKSRRQELHAFSRNFIVFGMPRGIACGFPGPELIVTPCRLIYPWLRSVKRCTSGPAPRVATSFEFRLGTARLVGGVRRMRGGVSIFCLGVAGCRRRGNGKRQRQSLEMWITTSRIFPVSI